MPPRSRFRKAVKRVLERIREQHFIQVAPPATFQAVQQYPAANTFELSRVEFLPNKGITTPQGFTGSRYEFKGWMVHGTVYVDADAVSDASARIHVFKVPRSNDTTTNGFFPTGYTTFPADLPFLITSCLPGATTAPATGYVAMLDNTYNELHTDAASRRNPRFNRGQPVHPFFRRVASYSLDTRRAEGSFHNYVKTFKFWIPYKKTMDNQPGAPTNMVEEVWPAYRWYLLMEGTQISVADMTLTAAGVVTGTPTGITTYLQIRSHFTDL